MIKATGGRQPGNSRNDPLGSPHLYDSLGKQIIRSLPITLRGETVPTVNGIRKMVDGWQSQCWMNEARRRNWKRILFLVPGETWNLCDPHSGSNTKNSLWFLLWTEHRRQRTGWTWCYRRLCRQIPERSGGCVKACSTHRLHKSIKDKLHLPDS